MCWHCTAIISVTCNNYKNLLLILTLVIKFVVFSHNRYSIMKEFKNYISLPGFKHFYHQWCCTSLHFCNSRTINVIPPSIPKIIFFNCVFTHSVYCTFSILYPVQHKALSLRSILVFIYYHYYWENYCLVTDFFTLT